MKKSKAIILALGSLLLFGCGGKKEKTPDLKHVNIVEVVDSEKSHSLSFTGRTKSADEVNVAFRVSGTIEQVLVKEGDYVNKGQVIARMDKRDYRIQLAATEAEYSQIKADAERVMALYAEGNTTAQNYDKARYGLEQITQKLNNHRNQLSDTDLHAPVSGYVKNKLHRGGETVAAGMPVVCITGKGTTEIEIKIPAKDFAEREKFTSFTCSFSTLNDERYELELVSTSHEANASQLYTMRFRIKGEYDHGKITPGMTTMVYARTDAENQSPCNIPSTAVLNKDGKTQVFIYDKSSKSVSLRQITLSSINADGTVTVASGVKSGEMIVSSGIHHINDGQKVEPIEPASASNVGGLL